MMSLTFTFLSVFVSCCSLAWFITLHSDHRGFEVLTLHSQFPPWVLPPLRDLCPVSRCRTEHAFFIPMMTLSQLCCHPTYQVHAIISMAVSGTVHYVYHLNICAFCARTGKLCPPVQMTYAFQDIDVSEPPWGDAVSCLPGGVDREPSCTASALLCGFGGWTRCPSQPRDWLWV